MRKLFKFKELIAIIITVASSVYFFNAEKFKLQKLDGDDLLIYPAILNIVILVLGIIVFSTLIDDYYLIKRKHGEYDNANSGLDDLNSISKILNISIDKTKYFVERTSAVVGQLIRNFSLFLWPLIIFYSLNILKDYLNLNLLSGFENTYSYSEFVAKNLNIESSKALWYLILSGLANIFNFISAIGLWVCFSILYQKTVDADNKSTLHLGVYYFLLTFYILSYIVLLGTGIELLTIKQTILTLDMFCSVFNCVAMILFFNRLVQMLYFFQPFLRKKLLDKFYFFIATILFPLYACFQIFFGVFDQLVSQGNLYYEYVKGAVFFICFLGKLFLILFLFTFVRIKWLHAAIITLLAYEETPMKLALNVTAISDNIDSIEDEIKDMNNE